MSTKDTYAKVFDAVISEMEQGRAPWVKPWSSTTGSASAMPHNATTGRPYSGGNVIALWLAGLAFTSQGWLTFKQALAADCVVRKGEKGTHVYYMSTAEDKKKERDEDGRPARFFFAKSYTVFNIDQLEELKVGALAKLRAKYAKANEPRPLMERLESAEQVVAATGAKIAHGGDRAFYVPTADRIQMPPAEAFDNRGAYYSTLFHELTHWTGHESRLDRITPSAFGKAEYAFEELVAELGAAFLSARFGFDTVTQSAAYLRSWATACRQSPDMFARAASLAAKAAELIHPTPSAEEEDGAELIAA